MYLANKLNIEPWYTIATKYAKMFIYILCGGSPPGMYKRNESGRFMQRKSHLRTDSKTFQPPFMTFETNKWRDGIDIVNICSQM